MSFPIHARSGCASIRARRRQSALIAGLGIAIGVAGAWALSRALESHLFGVEPVDVATHALGILFFAYAVSRRLGEIGIRMALGAGWLQIVSLFCRRTVLVVAIGLCAGLMGAAWLTRYIENLLFGVEPTDPLAFAATAALLAAAAMAATLVPMRRALRVDPAVTLRAE